MKRMELDDIKRGIETMNGNLAAVARSLGVSRQAVYLRVKDSAILQKALRDARESMLDNAESVLYRKVLDGSTPELIFFLKTQGRSRGYIERNELDIRTKNVAELPDDELEAIVKA